MACTEIASFCQQLTFSQLLVLKPKEQNINKTLTWMHLSSPILGKPTCRCVTGFTGPNCERRVCDNHCLNGGTCDVSPGNQPVCRCLAEYTGDRCLYRKYCKRLLVPSSNGQQATAF